MSSNKRGGGADHLYSGIMSAGKFANSPAANRERLIYQMYIRVLSELAMNRFKWSGLEEGMDQRFIEMCLFNKALAVVYFDERYDKLLAVQGGPNSGPSINNNPLAFNVLGPGRDNEIQTDANWEILYNFTVSAYDPNRHSDLSEEEKRRKAIPIWANYNRFPDIDIVQVYASRLAELDRTIEINSKNARRTKVLKVPQNQSLSGNNFIRELDGGSEVIQVNGPMTDLSFIEALDLSVSATEIEKLHILRTREWNECMGLLGIDNANQDKKERLVSDEVDANNEQTDTMKFVQLNSRRQACNLINDVFGTNLWVDYNTEVIEQEQNKNENDMKGGEENGASHDEVEDSSGNA